MHAVRLVWAWRSDFYWGQWGRAGRPVELKMIATSARESRSIERGLQTSHQTSDTLLGWLVGGLTLVGVIMGWTTLFADTSVRPHVILVMADDMGWGQTGYRNHPVLKTPHLDAMAANGLRFERFYAGGPVCSPTRASVLTGRSHDRAGVLSHGYALRLQEKTIAQALKQAGYVTGHFGKWHLNGFRGPGAPVLAGDRYRPSQFGFDEWVSVSNFFDLNPLLSRQGKIEPLEGDSSEIAVRQAVDFLQRHHAEPKPMFAVIWFGSPHSPFKAQESDLASFTKLNNASANHYAELVALDRSVGMLRQSLRELQIEQNTLLVFCSDNGGLPEIEPDTVGGLRGNKGTLYEGGIRVPGIIEWPATIRPRITSYPACVMDLFPTLCDLVGLPADTMLDPIDGVSLRPLFAQELATRSAPIGFRYQKKRALIDHRYKLLVDDLASGQFQLFDLVNDPQESRDLREQEPARYAEMKQQLLDWNASVDRSFAGQDYPERKVTPPDPQPINWFESPDYAPYLAAWQERWEYRSYLNRSPRDTKSAKTKTEKAKRNRSKTGPIGNGPGSNE